MRIWPTLADPQTETIAGLRTCWIGQAGTTPPVFFQHCTLVRAAAWGGVIAALPDDLCYGANDLPGHGGTAHDAGRDLQAQAAEIAAVLISRMDGPVVFVGHSFGATIGLRLARDHPELIQSLVLYEPVLFGLLGDVDHPAWAKEQAAQRQFITLLASDRHAATGVFVDRWGGAPWHTLPVARQQALVDGIGLVAASDAALFGPASGRVSADDLCAIPHPVVLLAGAETDPVIAPSQDMLAERLAVRARIRVPGAGHMGPITHPEPMAAAIRQLL